MVFQERLQRLINLSLIIYSFTICTLCHAAVRNILTALYVVIIIYLYRSKVVGILREFPRHIFYAYFIFVASLIIATILVGESKSINVAVDYIKNMCPLVLIYLLPKNDDSLKCVLCGLVIAVLTIGCYGIYDFVVLGKSRASGLYNQQPNMMGMVLALILPLSITSFTELCRSYGDRKLLKIAIFLCILAGVIGLFLTKSRGGILGFSLGLVITGIVYGIKNYRGKNLLKIMTSVCITTCILIGSLYLINGNKLTRHYDNERLLLIESSYNMWKDHKLYGVGLGNWDTEYSSKYILPQAKEPDLEMPHNIFAYYFSTTGLIGGIGFCSFLLLITHYCLSRMHAIKNGGLYVLGIFWSFVAICLHSCVDYGLIVYGIIRCFSFFLGLSAPIIEKQMKQSNGLLTKE